jgi:hypothetical protein
MDAGPSTNHDERCFGCGQTNLFGLLLESAHHDGGGLTARWFVKQDHQGPEPGSVHPGLLACALIEAALLAAGPGRALGPVECELPAGTVAGVGAFCDLSVTVEPPSVRAAASVEGRVVARLTAALAPSAVT